MENEFWPLGGTIMASFPPPPRSLQVWRQPSAHHPERSRVLFHETVHFWQYLASGYLAGIVEEDWGRLVAFERDQAKMPAGPRRLHFLQPHPEHGFAPVDLVEAFARFWDVHVIGPADLLEMEI